MERNPTNEVYQIYKSRKEYLKKLIVDIQCMDLLTEKGKAQIVSGLIHELDHIQQKIDDLLW